MKPIGLNGYQCRVDWDDARRGRETNRVRREIEEQQRDPLAHVVVRPALRECACTVECWVDEHFYAGFRPAEWDVAA